MISRRHSSSKNLWSIAKARIQGGLIQRGDQDQSVFDWSGVVLFSPTCHFESASFVKLQRGEIRSANFKQSLLGAERLAPLTRLLEQAGADSASSRVGPDSEIQYFEIASDPARDKKSCDGAIFISDPSRHLSSRDASVVPRGPLRDFGADELNGQNAIYVTNLDGANQDPAGAFQ